MSSVRLFALGGLGEIGMNCLVLEQRGEALLVDCGVLFGPRTLGVDVIHPAFDALSAYRVAGLVVTHGHEDHIGAIPYLLRRFQMPVYGPAYALDLVRERSAEHDSLAQLDARAVVPRRREIIGSFDVEPVRVTHSIVDATALAIRTDAGLVVHTGDFKFDDQPPDGEAFDVQRLQDLGRDGVRLLMSDSTNVDASGPTGSEQSVAGPLDEIIASAQGAVVVGLFASNVHRLRLLGEISARHGRKLVILGRSMATHSLVARRTLRMTGASAGKPYLEWPADILWPAERLRELPRRSWLVVATGSQGEHQSALARLARAEHPALELVAGDLVLLSSRVIPGNELDVMSMVTRLLRRGVEVRTWWSDRGIHVSGHAHRVELRRMIDLVRPQAFVPLHGTLHHLTRHAALAREAGVKQVCVLENGEVADFDRDSLRKIGHVDTGRVNVIAGREVSEVALTERAALASCGVVHVTALIDAHGQLAQRLELVSSGLPLAAPGQSLTEASEREVIAALERAASPSVAAELLSGGTGDQEASETVRQAVRRAFGRLLGFRPVTLVTIRKVESA